MLFQKIIQTFWCKIGFLDKIGVFGFLFLLQLTPPTQFEGQNWQGVFV